MCSSDGKFAPGSMMYFVLKGTDSKQTRAERMVDYLAEHAYSITLAVSLGQIKTLIEHPFSMTHSACPTIRNAVGVHRRHPNLHRPGRLARHYRDLELALEKV